MHLVTGRGAVGTTANLRIDDFSAAGRHADTSRVLSRSAVVFPLPRYVNLLPKPSWSLCAPVPQPILIHCRVMSMRANRQMEGIRTSNAILKHFILDKKCVNSTALPHIYMYICAY